MKKEINYMTSLLVMTALAPKIQAQNTNVVIIMPDDMSYSDFSFYNHNPLAPRTPNIDRLGRESVRLTDFHVAPTSSPSRSQLMTGRYDDQVGAWHTVMGRYFLRTDEITMADVFKANGFSTALFGKWHLGDSYPFRPKDRGFEHTAMHMGGGIDQQPDYWGNRNNVPCVLYVDDKQVELNDSNGSLPGVVRKSGQSNAFATNFFTSKSMEYMKACKDQNKPFFAYIAYNVTHVPQDTPPDARKDCSAFTATIENLDKNVGRLLDFFDTTGLSKNTIVIFILGDNGRTNFMYRGGKASEYEGGHHVPCFIRWPEGGYGGTTESSREIHTMVSEMDLLPTLMDILNLKDVNTRTQETQIEGHSMKSLFDADHENNDSVFANRVLVVDNQRMDDLIKYKQACVMQDELDSNGEIIHKWRLNRPDKSHPWELYDILTDTLQKSNILLTNNTSSIRKITQKLKNAYEDWWKKVSANASEYTSPIVGSEEEEEVCLFSHDWHMSAGLPPWNQTDIALGAKANGFNTIYFAKKGKYRFDLRRWPREIADETSLTSKLTTSIRSAIDNKPTFGNALAIHSARILIWKGDKIYADQSQIVKPESDGAIFTFDLPEGPVMIQTWFYDENGKELCGAYYNYVNLIKK